MKTALTTALIAAVVAVGGAAAVSDSSAAAASDFAPVPGDVAAWGTDRIVAPGHFGWQAHCPADNPVALR